jgi:hypothetical protein
LENLVVAQLVRKLLTGYGPEGSFHCSQEPDADPFPETRNQTGSSQPVSLSFVLIRARKSRVRFPTRLLDFSIDLILLAALWPEGRLSL